MLLILLTTEPLYQHIHNAEFGFNPSSIPVNDDSPLQVSRKTTVRLFNKLWRQQTKVLLNVCKCICTYIAMFVYTKERVCMCVQQNCEQTV